MDFGGCILEKVVQVELDDGSDTIISSSESAIATRPRHDVNTVGKEGTNPAIAKVSPEKRFGLGKLPSVGFAA
ncbi:hypothetical protein [Lyngbya sp. CCY1209]|uniref:hypothetical protein n=1 Tax=Lyngbya sp. CCY1209 TaxID=2886103 RepID=UPI002D1FF6D1|nr:hypothetical protein [Lyngbya sp. CCY1209]MEB3882546.1 hypothetical protein [Lyngbya sp. CCY1209]